MAVALGWPKLRFPRRHSPLAWGLRRSQSGMKSPSVSVQVRLLLETDVSIGLFILAMASVCPATYRPTLNLTAVLPLPNKSYETPSRGAEVVPVRQRHSPVRSCCRQESRFGQLLRGHVALK